MKTTKDTISVENHNVELGISVSEENVGFIIMDKSTPRMFNAQTSHKETEVIVHFLAKKLGIKNYLPTVKRQASVIEDTTNRNEELRTQLCDLIEKAENVFSDYEAGNLPSGHDMLSLIFECQKAGALIERTKTKL